MAEYKATCKDCLHFDLCCEWWAYETEGVATADNFRVWNADKVPCTDCFKNKADVVEVVRCKDCIHYYELEPVCLKIYSDGNVSADAWQERKPNDFCSYGCAKMDGKERAK